VGGRRGRRPGVCDLHEWIDREAERGDDRAQECDEPVGGIEARDLWWEREERVASECECAADV